MDLNELFAAVESWATARSDVRAAASTSAHVTSEQDPRALAFLLLTAHPDAYARGEHWPRELGSLSDARFESGGTTLRIVHRDGHLLLLRFVTPAWFESEHPRLLDSGGMLPLLDRDNLLAAAFDAAAARTPEPPPPRADITYSEWLALNSVERAQVLATWNPYQHDNVHIPREAARRFREQCKYPCVSVDAGVYHMGEYILGARLRTSEMSKEEIAAVPEWLATEFDGFRIGYIGEE